MNRRAKILLVVCACVAALAGCATRPVNPRIDRVDPDAGYRFITRQRYFESQETLIVLAFSGGGTRAAAFSYGVLEALRDTELPGRRGKGRMLDAVDIVTGVSGGSFTALAYGLYGEQLFDRYERDFLKRDVEGALLARLFDPLNWGDLWSTGWGRSELAARYYDEILFHGATFADLQRGRGPLIVVTATDISTGARVPFQQPFFDVMCSDLGAVQLARAAAASSAVPVVLSPVTFNNYGGSCGYRPPAWIANLVASSGTSSMPSTRFKRQLAELAAYGDGMQRPYIHVVDGGVADNLGLRGAIDVLDALEAEYVAGRPTPLDHVRRIAIFVVNSLSRPATHWDGAVDAPGTLAILLKASGVPIDHFSFEAIELLGDTEARWKRLRRIRASPAFDAARDPALAREIAAPPIDLYTIDVSFPELDDKAEVEYLNSLPTSFVLSDEAVDRLRAAARKIVESAPEFKRFMHDLGTPPAP